MREVNALTALTDDDCDGSFCLSSRANSFVQFWCGRCGPMLLSWQRR